MSDAVAKALKVAARAKAKALQHKLADTWKKHDDGRRTNFCGTCWYMVIIIDNYTIGHAVTHECPAWRLRKESRQ